MYKPSEQKLHELQQDIELRPLVFDFVCAGLKVGFTDVFEVHHPARTRFQKEYYDTLATLSKEVSLRVSPAQVMLAIHDISMFYLSQVSRISFDQYGEKS